MLKVTGGEQGCLSKSNLEYLLDTVRDIGKGSEKRAALLKKATFLPCNLVLLHPFVNGSKRTAIELVRLFLQVSGLELKAKPDDAYSFALNIAASRVSMGDIEKRIVGNLAEFERD